MDLAKGTVLKSLASGHCWVVIDYFDANKLLYVPVQEKRWVYKLQLLGGGVTRLTPADRITKNFKLAVKGIDYR